MEQMSSLGYGLLKFPEFVPNMKAVKTCFGEFWMVTSNLTRQMPYIVKQVWHSGGKSEDRCIKFIEYADVEISEHDVNAR